MSELVREYGASGWQTGEPSGGSLPAWWTVDSTAGDESVAFDGYVVINSDHGDPDASAVLSVWGDDAALGSIVSFYTNRTDFDGLDVHSNGTVNITAHGDGSAVFELRAYNDDEFAFDVTVGKMKFGDSVNNRIGFWGTSPTDRKTLDPATCTAEDIANALIASTFMAAA